jgi:hypothetical protein
LLKYSESRPISKPSHVLLRISQNQSLLVELLPTLIVGLGSLALYVITLAPTVLFADGGEFQFVPYILGIAHPPGYPLYLLLGWAWSHALPVGDVAYRMNLFSAFWAAVAVGLTCLVALKMVRRAVRGINPISAHLAAATAAITFAAGKTFWSQAVIAEVYSFNAFLVALILLLLFWLEEAPERTRPVRGRISTFAWRSLVLAAVFGLSLTHHLTVLLLVPGMLAFLRLTQRSSGRRRVPDGSGLAAPETRPLSMFAPRSALRRAGFALALLVALMAPLLLYAYLPLRAPHTPYTTIQLSDSQTLTLYESSWRGFIDHVSASVFAGNLALPPTQSVLSVVWSRWLTMVWGLLREQVGLVGIGLAIIGLVRLVATKRRALLALSGLGYAASVAFNLVYSIGDVEVLFIPSYLFVSLWLSIGVVTLAQGVAAGLVRWKGSRVTYADFGQRGYRRLTEGVYQLTTQIVTLLALALPIVLLATHFSVVDQSHNTQAQEMWQTILSRPIPEGAVLLSNDRNEIMPLWYYQYVEGQRPDLLGLFPLVVSQPTYSSLGGLIDQALLSQRPSYLIKPMPGLDVKARLEPDAELSPLVHLIGPAMERPPIHPRQIALAGIMRLVGYDQSPSSARPGQQLTVTLYWQPQSEVDVDYTSYVHLVDETGRGITQLDHLAGGDYYPTSLWRPGEVLRDDHVLTIPEDVEPGVYRLLVGMYHYPQMESLGGPADIGLVAVKDPASVQMALSTDVLSQTESLRTTDIEFSDRLALLGYDPKLVEGRLQLTLYWQAERLLDQNWTVFVHLADNSGALVAQHDSQPRDGAYPTSVWDPGEVVADQHEVRLPVDLPEGDYQVVVGLYTADSGERLPVLDSQGNPAGDSVPLVTLGWIGQRWEIK